MEEELGLRRSPAHRRRHPQAPAALDEITYRASTNPDPERLLPGRIQQPHSCEEHP